MQDPHDRRLRFQLPVPPVRTTRAEKAYNFSYSYHRTVNKELLTEVRQIFAQFGGPPEPKPEGTIVNYSMVDTLAEKHTREKHFVRVLSLLHGQRSQHR